MKEGGSLVGGPCESCEDRAPSGLRQDSVRTLSGLCQDSVRTVRTGAGGPQTRLRTMRDTRRHADRLVGDSGTSIFHAGLVG